MQTWTRVNALQVSREPFARDIFDYARLELRAFHAVAGRIDGFEHSTAVEQVVGLANATLRNSPRRGLAGNATGDNTEGRREHRLAQRSGDVERAHSTFSFSVPDATMLFEKAASGSARIIPEEI